MRRCLICVALLVAWDPASSRAQVDNVDFPDRTQTSLLIGQAERAMESYELAIKNEEVGLGKDGQQSASRDREVLKRVRQYLPKLKVNPEGFNGPVGFLLVVDLQDASRNMALCMGQAGMEAGLSAVVGNTPTGEGSVALGQACGGASQLLYTVSETAASLYETYLLANWKLQQRQQEAIGKCSELLKKAGPVR